MIEVKVLADADIGEIARTLIEPLEERYTEVLVYFYERRGKGELPIRRAQWTASGGYHEIVY